MFKGGARKRRKRKRLRGNSDQVGQLGVESKARDGECPGRSSQRRHYARGSECAWHLVPMICVIKEGVGREGRAGDQWQRRGEDRPSSPAMMRACSRSYAAGPPRLGKSPRLGKHLLHS